MKLLAGLLSGVFVYFLVGYLTGYAPSLELRAHARRQVSSPQLWLIQAGLDVTPRQFWGASIGAGLGTMLLFFTITGTPVVAVVPAVVVALLPRAYFARRRGQRLAEVQRAWPDGLRDLLASVSAGMSLRRAVEALSRSGPEPLREAFARFQVVARTVGVVPALETIREELADPTSDRVIEVLILAHERGGNIVPEILQELAETTTRDIWALEEIRTQSLEQKINARVVFVLPWLVLVALTAQPGAFRAFYRSSAGVLVVAVGGAMSLFGMWLVGRLGREPEEERVLGGSAIVIRAGESR